MRLLRSVLLFVVVFLAADHLAPRDRFHEAEIALDRAVDQYVERKRRLANLDALRNQLRDAERVLAELKFELPDRHDLEFAPVRSAAARRGLRVMVMRPGQEVAREFYAELPLRIMVSGRFHDLGAFAADLGRAPGSLLLHGLSLNPALEPGRVTLEGWVSGFRFLSDEEVAAQRKKAPKGKA